MGMVEDTIGVASPAHYQACIHTGECNEPLRRLLVCRSFGWLVALFVWCVRGVCYGIGTAVRQG